MNTIKTSLVVVLLLGVLYGVYVVLNQPSPEPPPEAGPWEDLAPPQIEMAEMSSSGGGPLSVSVPPGPPSSEPSPAAVESAELVQAPTPEPERASSYAPAGGPPAEPTSDTEPGTQPPAPSPDAVTVEMTDRPSSEALTKPAAPDDASAPAATASGGPADEPAAAASESAEPPPASEPDAEPDPASRAIVSRAFQNAVRSAMAQINNGQYRAALFTLSIFYNSPDLSPEEQQQLLDMLDPLAAKVIYSREHLLEPAYKVGRKETLQEIADRYHVPWRLLQNINHIRDPEALAPGTELKVVRGPFRAEVDLKRQELTLFLGRLYAGRFPITIGQDPAPRPGDFVVRSKQLNRAYYGADGRTIPGDDPANPYGGVWLDLGDQLSIHGSPRGAVRQDNQLGCISLSPIDAQDVFAILSEGSTVTIRR